jgi:hypothetical protein
VANKIPYAQLFIMIPLLPQVKERLKIFLSDAVMWRGVVSGRELLVHWSNMWQNVSSLLLAPCPNKCKEGRNKVKCFMRRDLDKHLRNGCPNRDHSCQYCGKKGTYAKITWIHDDKCEEKILPCSNVGCTETMERQNIDEHVRTECPHTVVPCKHKGIGCTSQLKRIDMPAHEQDDKLHFHMALDTVNVLQDTISVLQDKCLTVTLKNDHSEFMTFAVSDYQKMEEAGVTFTSPPFYTHINGYLMEVTGTKVFSHLDESGVKPFIRVLKGNHDA